MNIFWTIVVGVLCGIIAGVLTPNINIPSIIFGFLKARSKLYKTALENDARYLLNHPSEEVNIRISNNTALINWSSMFAIGILYILYKESGIPLTSFSKFIGYTPAIILFIISSYFSGRVMKYSVVLSEVDKQKRENRKRNGENTKLY